MDSEEMRTNAQLPELAKDVAAAREQLGEAQEDELEAARTPEVEDDIAAAASVKAARSALAGKVHALRAVLNEKSEARRRATEARERLAAEMPRLRSVLSDASDLVKRAKVTELLKPGPQADQEVATARQRYEATMARLDDVEERVSLLAEVEKQLYAEVPLASEELKLAEAALLREVLRRRAEESRERLGEIVADIALSSYLEGTALGDAGIMHEIRKRVGRESGLVGSSEEMQALRAKLLRAEGAL